MDSPYLSSHGSPASPSFYRTAGSSPQQSFNNAFTSSNQPPPFFNAFGSLGQQQSQQQQSNNSSSGVPTTGPAALDYASAQLSNYAAQQQNQNQNNNVAGTSMYNRGPPTPGGGNANANNPSSPTSMIPQLSQLPPGMDFSNMTLHSANSSAPASAASSPGWTHRRLPSSSSSQQQSSTHTHNPRIAASAVTGKRLNWGEMICATIYHSEHGRLVIQDLFEQMCKRFPEVQEWAFGKDWEARVKNRIKSTLSIKGHLFIKVPRPPSAAGKGSWWTLSQEAQDAFRENRLAPLLKMSNGGPGSASHSRSNSRGGTGDGFAMSAVTSAAPSRFNSPGPASGAATPIKQHASAHPLAQQPFGAGGSGSGSPSMQQDAQARQAAQLAQLQEQLLKQQQAQRDALPGSYDPNAPPSSGTNMPPLYFDQQTGGPTAQTPFGSFPSGQGGFTPTDSDSFLAALSAYQNQNEGIPVPGAQGKQQQQQNPFAGSMGGMGGMGGMPMSMSFGNGSGGPPGSGFESGSFGATLNALSALDEQRRRELMRMSDSSGTDSFESSGASASGSGSGGGSSYGIGSPQSIPHLGGPQSMPFPAAARFAGPGGMGVVPQQGGAGGAGGQGATTGMGQGQAPQGGGSALLSSPFDPQGGFAHQQAQGQQQNQQQSQQQGQPQSQSQSQQQQQQQQLFLQSFMQGTGAGTGGAHNPFGVSLPGGYAMPGGPQQQQSFYPSQQPQSGSNGSGSGDQPIAPSPADSTSAFFAFTPATGPVDSNSNPHSREGTEGLGGTGEGAGNGGGESALGPMVGNKHRAGRGSVSNGNGNGQGGGNGGQGGGGNGLQRVDESFSLPPPAQRR